MRDKTGCPAEHCYGDVEPGSKHCSWNLCPLDALEGCRRSHGTPPQHRLPGTWHIIRALLAAWLKLLVEWIEP